MPSKREAARQERQNKKIRQTALIAVGLLGLAGLLAQTPTVQSIKNVVINQFDGKPCWAEVLGSTKINDHYPDPRGLVPIQITSTDYTIHCGGTEMDTQGQQVDLGDSPYRPENDTKLAQIWEGREQQFGITVTEPPSFDHGHCATPVLADNVTGWPDNTAVAGDADDVSALLFGDPDTGFQGITGQQSLTLTSPTLPETANPGDIVMLTFDKGEFHVAEVADNGSEIQSPAGPGQPVIRGLLEGISAYFLLRNPPISGIQYGSPAR